MIHSRQSIDRKFGFRVPETYIQLLKVAQRLDDELWNAFDPLMFYVSKKQIGLRALPTATPPELVVLGWTGADDGHYGFLVDNPSQDSDEYSIGEFYADGGGGKTIAASIPEFLGSLYRELVDDYGEGPDSDLDPKDQRKLRLTMSLLTKEFEIPIPDAEDLGAYEVKASAHLKRKQRKDYISTEDGFGVFLPKDSVDRRYVRSLKWPSRCIVTDPEIPPDDKFLDVAERRLKSGEPGTALIVSRNFWHHYRYDRNRRIRKARIRRLGNLMEKSYRALAREFEARIIRDRVDHDLELIDKHSWH